MTHRHYPCPDAEKCSNAECRERFVDVEEFPDESGEAFPAFCYRLSPPEPFLIPCADFNEYQRRQETEQDDAFDVSTEGLSALFNINPTCFKEIQTLYRLLVVEVRKRLGFRTDKQAVRYVIKDAKRGGELFAECKRVREIARRCGVDLESTTLYTYAKDLGSEKASSKGVGKRAVTARKRRLVRHDLKAMHGP